jgi:hypothetical protein
MISGISIPFEIIEFQNHKKIKFELLKDIENNPYPSISSYDHKISKSDWNSSSDEKNYTSLFLKEINPGIKGFVESINFKKYVIHDIWFQQYIDGDSHSWHNHHGCHYTCIYYLELECGPFTQFINPIDDQSIFQIEVKEGDILVIPSMIKHRSPIITNNKRKTIISFNLSLICDNNVVEI